MNKYYKYSKKGFRSDYTGPEIKKLLKMAGDGCSSVEIGEELKRDPILIRQKIERMQASLKVFSNGKRKRLIYTTKTEPERPKGWLAKLIG